MQLNQRGWSLLKVLVAAGVMAFIAMSIVSILGTQYREGLALNEKIAAINFKKMLIQTLADGDRARVSTFAS